MEDEARNHLPSAPPLDEFSQAPPPRRPSNNPPPPPSGTASYSIVKKGSAYIFLGIQPQIRGGTPPAPAPIVPLDPPDLSDIEFYVKRVRLELQGKDVTSLGVEDNDAYNCMENYIQFQNTVGSTFGSKSMNLPYEHFIKYFYVVGFDLACNEESYLTAFQPSRRNGWYQIKVDFSAPTTKNITLVAMAEFPSMISIDSYGLVNKSYKV